MCSTVVLGLILTDIGCSRTTVALSTVIQVVGTQLQTTAAYIYDMVLNFQTQFPSPIGSSCSADKTSHIYISNSFYLAYRFPAASKLLILLKENLQKASRDPILNKKPSPYRIHQGLTMPRGFQVPIKIAPMQPREPQTQPSPGF